MCIRFNYPESLLCNTSLQNLAIWGKKANQYSVSLVPFISLFRFRLEDVGVRVQVPLFGSGLGCVYHALDIRYACFHCCLCRGFQKHLAQFAAVFWIIQANVSVDLPTKPIGKLQHLCCPVFHVSSYSLEGFHFFQSQIVASSFEYLVHILFS